MLDAETTSSPSFFRTEGSAARPRCQSYVNLGWVSSLFIQPLATTYLQKDKRSLRVNSCDGEEAEVSLWSPESIGKSEMKPQCVDPPCWNTS